MDIWNPYQKLKTLITMSNITSLFAAIGAKNASILSGLAFITSLIVSGKIPPDNYIELCFFYFLIGFIGGSFFISLGVLFGNLFKDKIIDNLPEDSSLKDSRVNGIEETIKREIKTHKAKIIELEK